MATPKTKLDPYETEILADYEAGAFRSVATKAELAKFREAARATAIKDRRVNIRLSSGDLADIQARETQGTVRLSCVGRQRKIATGHRSGTEGRRPRCP